MDSLSSMAIVLAAVCSGCQGAETHFNPPPSRPSLAITARTYNVNYGAVSEETLQAVGQGAPDIVLLQETNAPWERAIRQRWSDQYPHMHFHHSRGAGGVAVLSRWNLSAIRVEPAPEPGWFPAMFATVSGPFGDLQLVNVHLRPPFDDQGNVLRGYFTTPKIRRTEMAHYLQVLARRSRGVQPRAIIAGDFNESATGQAVSLAAEHGLVSVKTTKNGHADTWRWQTRFGTARRHLDHLLVDPALLEVVSARVRDMGASDHLPVDVTLRKRAQ